MARATSNRLLPPLVSIVILMLIVVTLRACTPASESTTSMLSQVPVAPPPDVDTPADTIKTLTANVAAMNEKLDGLREDNAELQTQNAALRDERVQIENTVSDRLNEELDASRIEHNERRKRDAELFASLSRRLDRINQSLADATSQTPSNEMPIGFGFDSPPTSDASLVWINPLDEGTTRSALASHGSGLTPVPKSERIRSPSAAPTITAGVESHPAYTVPRNATLIGATAMTALVGRVPTQGQVRDAMPFKVITGHDNLAANGLTVPGVQGMVWSGTAVGDWTLSCVTGRLNSVTFVFDDGTIQTISSDKRAGQGGDNEPLAWISDDQGIPCVSGEKVERRPFSCPAYRCSSHPGGVRCGGGRADYLGDRTGRKRR